MHGLGSENQEHKFFGHTAYQHDIKLFDDSEGKRSIDQRKSLDDEPKLTPEKDKIDQIKKIATVQHVMTKASQLITEFLKDDSRVENLQETINILSLGQELCTSKIEEMEQATQEEFLAIKSRLQAQFDRFESFEKSQAFKKLAPA